MDTATLLGNLATAPVLFFLVGVLAVLGGSDVDVPQPLPKLFSLYLLLAIGLRGGVELEKSGLGASLLVLAAAVGMALVVPVYSFFVLRLRLDVANAGAIAATYGSISAVTFITATSYLDGRLPAPIPHSGHMVAAMALMESPAIVVGVLLVRLFGKAPGESAGASSWRELVQHSLLNQSVFLLLASLAIGRVVGSEGWHRDLEPFFGKLFKGMLCLFLLDLGLVAARRWKDLRRAGAFLVAFALLSPIANALAGILVARLLGLGPGDALLFAVLCGSASYIAVPAAMRLAVPEANPGLYVSMALAITFPFNVVLGIPGYSWLIGRWWGT